MTNDAHAQSRAYAQVRLDARLAPEHQAWLAAHLAGCAECRRYAAELNASSACCPRPSRPVGTACPFRRAQPTAPTCP